MNDLLWSDPDDNICGWRESPRGAGFLFGEDMSKEFNHKNNLKMIGRAHQLFSAGFNKTHDDNVVTVFSCPNYCFRCGNQGAMLDLDENMGQTYIQYDHAALSGQKV